MTVRIDGAGRRRPRHATWRGSVVAVAFGVLAVGVSACGSDAISSSNSSSVATGATGARSGPSAGATDPTMSATDALPASHAVQLDVDPCTLLTVAEIEVAVGPGVERGGFGEDLPGRCTYSVGSDVGAGVVAISLEDPLVCAAIQRAIDSGGAEQMVVVDVGQGGIVESYGTIGFLVGGGCVSISGSTEGASLSEDVLVTLAKAAAQRIG